MHTLSPPLSYTVCVHNFCVPLCTDGGQKTNSPSPLPGHVELGAGLLAFGTCVYLLSHSQTILSLWMPVLWGQSPEQARNQTQVWGFPDSKLWENVIWCWSQPARGTLRGQGSVKLAPSLSPHLISIQITYVREEHVQTNHQTLPMFTFRPTFQVNSCLVHRFLKETWTPRPKPQEYGPEQASLICSQDVFTVHQQ